ncbi:MULTISPECIES: CU044_2847 family protein [unclassified Kribbella]|uniref:CU044_2847 family protein n=1 Tax=unclassified Kribbella TaxID=2644121 RepID=UPI0037971B54|nr:hypothetical protein OG817_24650 [Kribbella sp. NBC_00889]
MSSQLVSAGGADFYVEVVNIGGPQTIGSNHEPLSLDGVRDTILAVATELGQIWDKVKPAEATVDFGLKLIAKSGKLTGLIVDGGGEATLSISLTWKAGDQAEPG